MKEALIFPILGMTASIAAAALYLAKGELAPSFWAASSAGWAFVAWIASRRGPA